METTNINTGVNSLLTAAKYVREETLINGNQAAQLDSLINTVVELTARVDEYAAKIADRLAKGLSVERLQKWMGSAKGKLTAAVESLREWLKAFKADRPNVQINIEDNTTPEKDTTMKEETNANVQEYNHAAYCLDIYLMNDADINNRFTVPAIELAAAGLRSKWMPNVIEHGKKINGVINNALQVAARLVQKHDHMTPTPEDIAAIKANYVAYIIECAQYEVNNA